MKQKLLITLITLSLLIAACSSAGGTTPTPQVIPTVIADSTIVAEGRLEPIRYAEIAFTSSGVVNEVLVQEGQAVKKGATLIQLGDESDSEYAAAQLELANAQKALNDLQNGSPEDLAKIVIDLKDAKEEYNKAQDYLKYLQNKPKVWQTDTRRTLLQTRTGYRYHIKIRSFRGPVPQDWITNAENDLALKKAKWEDLQRSYDRMKEGIDKDELAVLEARLHAAKAGLAAFTVVAPFDGVVTDLKAKAGSSINAGEIAVTVADLSNWLVKTTDLTEIDVVKLQEGQPATVTLDALPGVELKGKIRSIGQNYSENQGDIVYKVTILLTDKNPAMRWGMTTAVAFENQE